MSDNKSLNKDGNLDQMSQLPEDLIHRILSFVPIDAARTCTLSKTWNGICSSHSINLFDNIDYNKFVKEIKESLLSAESGQELDIREMRDRFLKYASSQLLRMKKTSLPVKDRNMNVAVTDTEDSCVDQLMELLSQTKVETLFLAVQTIDSCRPEDVNNKTKVEMYLEEMHPKDKLYNFPYSVLLASQWLQSLTLQKCRLSSAAGNVIRLCTSLRRLRLLHVTVLDEEALNNLACCCPRVEFIKSLSDFPMLKKASVENNHLGSLKFVDIRESTNQDEVFDQPSCWQKYQGAHLIWFHSSVSKTLPLLFHLLR